jgi:cytochrome c oxidase subunit 2
MGEVNHGRRFATLWLICTIIALPIVIWVIGPHMGYGKAATGAEDQAEAMTVLAATATPFMVLVGLFLIYAAIFFRQPKHEALEGPAVRDNAKIQLTWIVVTSITVLAIAVYGSVELISKYGGGSGSGASPLNRPSHVGLKVQVIGQQWQWTYRWPEFGGVETKGIELPVNQMIEFNVTSLDVIHSWTVKELGIKADANPQVNNIAFTEPTKLTPFEVRCTELCGIWHGAMFGYGRVVSDEEFLRWIRAEQVRNAAVIPHLPPFALTYQPQYGGTHHGGFEEPEESESEKREKEQKASGAGA